MDYGHFGTNGREYIITNPNTPRPWINFLTNEEYCAVISATGGGYSFYRDCKTERLNWWLGPNLNQDRPGRYIFLRDEGTRDVWSATWQPIRNSYGNYECRVGLGYQIIRQDRMGIGTEVRYFVPRKETCEFWTITVTNKTKKKKKLRLFGYTEWFMGSTDYINFYNISILWNRVGFSKSLNAIVARKTAFYQEFNIKPNPYIIFMSSTQKPTGWDCRKEEFLGRYNTVEHPSTVYDGHCQNLECDGEEPVGVLEHVIELAPGQSKTLTYIVGQSVGMSGAAKILSKYKQPKSIETEFEKVQEYWTNALAPIQVETPDPDFNNIANIWVKYQLYMCNFWSRSPSFYHEGQGGRGYRDSSQDAESIVSLNPAHSAKKIKKIASLTRRDGTVAPGWSDTYGPFPNRPFKDHPTWLTPTVAAYVKETGDVDFLNERVPWLRDRWQKGGTEVDLNWKDGAIADGEGTIFEHLLAQLEFTYDDVSVHGIPRVGEADWNDALDMAGRRQIGESVWLAMALVRSLKVASELAEKLGKKDLRKNLLEKAETMTERINEHGWDGNWYLGGFNDDLVPFGSHKNKEGKIFLNSQSWAVLAGIVPKNRVTTMLRAVEKELAGPHGPALLAPAYTTFDPGLGRIAMFSEGTKENAAVFCHAATFLAAAYCQLGMGDKAYETLCKIMPNKQKDMERYKSEPYVYAEYLVGPDNPYRYGEGAYTWVTGTAGWTFMVMTEWILGARRDYDGLRIDPCLPKSWKKARIVRPFRGATYDVRIENPKGISKGVKELWVDGKKIAGNLIKPHGDGKTHAVRVLLG